jgi:hypothetical protein
LDKVMPHISQFGQAVTDRLITRPTAYQLVASDIASNVIKLTTYAPLLAGSSLELYTGKFTDYSDFHLGLISQLDHRSYALHFDGEYLYGAFPFTHATVDWQFQTNSNALYLTYSENHLATGTVPMYIGDSTYKIDIYRAGNDNFQNAYRINALLDPSSAQDAATKNYVDTHTWDRLTSTNGTLVLTDTGVAGHHVLTSSLSYVDSPSAWKITNAANALYLSSSTAYMHIGTGTPSILNLLTLIGKSSDGHNTALSFVMTNDSVDNAVYSARFNGSITRNNASASIYGSSSFASYDGVNGGTVYGLFGSNSYITSLNGRAVSMTTAFGALVGFYAGSAMTITGNCGGGSFGFDINDTASVITHGMAIDVADMNGNSSGGSGTVSKYSGIHIGNSVWDATDGQAIRIDDQSSWGGNAADKGNISMEGGNWDSGHIQLGTAHIWFDGTHIRGKVSAPTSASDGSIIV